MRYYSSTAVEMALTGAVNEIVTTLVVDTVLGLPAQTPFTLVVDVGLSTEEIVTVTEVSGTSLTVTRGEDSSTAVAHTIGAVVRHMMTARDLRDPAVHVAAATNVHSIGATASVVGTDTAQTLTNKTVNFADNTILGVPQASVTNLVDDLAALALAAAADATAKVLAATRVTVAAKGTANVGPVSTTDVTVISAPAIDADGVGRFKITATTWVCTSVAADMFDFKIKDSTTGTVIATHRVIAGAGGYVNSPTAVCSDVPAAGSHVYQLVAIRVGAGTGPGTIFASATAPIEIIVEQVS